MGKKNNILSLILNLFIVVNMVLIMIDIFFSGAEGNMSGIRFEALKYYTVDSNILCAVSCAALAACNIKALKTGKLEIPQPLLILKFAGTVATMVTFLVVLLFLGPVFGYDIMYTGNNLYMHLLNAIVALVGFIFFEKGFKFEKNKFAWGDLSVAVYGTLYFIMVIILKKWNDFYGFATVSKWWISFPVMLIFGYYLSKGIWKLYNISNKKTSDE